VQIHGAKVCASLKIVKSQKVRIDIANRCEAEGKNAVIRAWSAARRRQIRLGLSSVESAAPDGALRNDGRALAARFQADFTISIGTNAGVGRNKNLELRGLF
jgi:hypothetical protein